MKQLFLLLLLFNTAYAQDLIYLKGKATPINAKVIEINSTEVKYKLPSDSFPIMYFLKIEVEKIELSNATVIEVEKEEVLNVNTRVGSVKVGLFSPFFDHTNIGYEGYTKNNQSWVITAGIIGLGHQIDDSEQPKGGYLNLGYKWITGKKIRPNIHPQKILAGFFVKPELSVGKYTIHYDDKYVGTYNYVPYPAHGYYTYTYVPVESKEITFGAALINFGYQAVSTGGLTLELNAGLGCYLYSQREVEDFNYTFITVWSDSTPLAVSLGLKLGYTFCKEKRFQVAN